MDSADSAVGGGELSGGGGGGVLLQRRTTMNWSCIEDNWKDIAYGIFWALCMLAIAFVGLSVNFN